MEKEPAIKKPDFHDRIFYGALAIVLALKLLYIGFSGQPLSPEEAYYWCYSRNPDFSYFDHPPMVAWIIALFTAVFGHTAFAVRLGAVLLSAGTTWLVYRTAKKFYDGAVGLFSALLLNLTLVFCLYSAYITPDTPLLFFWMAALWSFLGALERDRRRDWAAFGIFMGCAMLSKYTAFLLGLAFFCYFILYAFSWSRLFRFLWSSLIALLCFSPVIYWNYIHGFSSFLFQSSHRVSTGLELDVENIFGYILLQLVYVTPLIFGAFAVVLIKKLRPSRGFPALAAFTSFYPFLFFTLVAVVSWVKANWPAPVYLTGMIAVAAFFAQCRKKKAVRVYVNLMCVTSFLICLLGYVQPLAPGIFPGLSRANSTAGWDSLGRYVDGLRQKMPDPDGVFLIGNGYQIAAELQFYTSGNKRVYSRNAFNLDALGFDYWRDPQLEKGRDALVVTGKFEKFSPVLLEKYFTSYEEAAPYEVTVAGESLWSFRVFLCYGYKGH